MPSEDLKHKPEAQQPNLLQSPKSCNQSPAMALQRKRSKRNQKAHSPGGRHLTTLQETGAIRRPEDTSAVGLGIEGSRVQVLCLQALKV